MNLEIRKAKRSALVAGPGPGGGGPGHVPDTGELGANHGDDQTPETRGAPKALAGDTLTPETKAGDLQADPEIERKRTQAEEDPKHHLRATAQPGDLTAGTGDAREVEARADLLPKRGLLLLLEDTRRRRKGTRKETKTARVTKTAVVRNASAPPARKRKVRTKSGNASGRGNQTERRETSSL